MHSVVWDPRFACPSLLIIRSELVPSAERYTFLDGKHCNYVAFIGSAERDKCDGSKFGSNLPVLLAAFSGLNGVESTDRFKVNSRMLYR
jgi:hypothetical protein